MTVQHFYLLVVAFCLELLPKLLEKKFSFLLPIFQVQSSKHNSSLLPNMPFLSVVSALFRSQRLECVNTFFLLQVLVQLVTESCPFSLVIPMATWVPISNVDARIVSDGDTEAQRREIHICIQFI